MWLQRSQWHVNLLPSSAFCSPNTLTVLRSYKRRRDTAQPSYSKSPPAANGVEVCLDSSGSDVCWVIRLDGRELYRMLPNPADPDYGSFPNFDGVWYTESA